MRYFRDNSDMRLQKKMLSEDLKFPYVMKVTNSRIYLDSTLGSFMTSEDRIPIRELGYIDRVKQFIIKNKLYNKVPKVKRSSIDYFKYSPALRYKTPIPDCHEIDLKHAYWELLNELGLLDPSLYKLASEINPATREPFISKPTRLACVGALARSRRIYTFDGKKEVQTWDNSPLTAHIWDYVCFKISEIMMEARKAAGKDFIFFWVDACFVKSQVAKDRVMEVFKKHGYNYTEIDIESIELLEKIEVVKKGEKVKKKLRKFIYAPHKQ